MPPILFDADGAIIYAVTHHTHILLVRQLNIPDPKWKMPGESIEPGETLAHAFRRGLFEEAGLRIPLPKHTKDTLVLENNKISLKMLLRRRIEHKRTHVQHFYRVELAYFSKLKSLGGKILPPAGGEQMETKVFELGAVRPLPDFLEHQLPLLTLLEERLAQAA